MDLGALRSTNMTMNDLAATAGLDWMELPLAKLSIMFIACIMFVAQIFPSIGPGILDADAEERAHNVLPVNHMGCWTMWNWGKFPQPRTS
jgi:hypothetical protein